MDNKEKPENPNAFPYQYEFVDGSKEYNDGMTLRDYFAAKAMVGLLSGNMMIDGKPNGDPNVLAKAAYVMADAMLKARQQ